MYIYIYNTYCEAKGANSPNPNACLAPPEVRQGHKVARRLFKRTPRRDWRLEPSLSAKVWREALLGENCSWT